MIEKDYLEARKRYYRNWEREFPIFNKIVFGKHYILPNYRQPDYHSQDACDFLLLDALFAYLEGTLSLSDIVLGHTVANFVALLHYNKPTFFLEKELGFPLLKTPLPLDYYAQDINWRWPAFRVYLPKDLLTLTKPNYPKPAHVMFLDIVKIEENSEEGIPTTINRELSQKLPKIKFPGMVPLRKSSFEGMCVSGFFSFNDPESAIAYVASTELTQKSIREIMEFRGELKSPWKLDSIDEEFNNRMLALGINILLFLSTFPIEYEQQHIKPLRQPKQEGRHLIPGLYPARFIGQSQLRPKSTTTATTTTTTTTKHQDPQWRAGHWKRIWFGPKKGQHRLQWISIYHTGETEPETKEKEKEKSKLKDEQ